MLRMDKPTNLPQREPFSAYLVPPVVLPIVFFLSLALWLLLR